MVLTARVESMLNALNVRKKIARALERPREIYRASEALILALPCRIQSQRSAGQESQRLASRPSHDGSAFQHAINAVAFNIELSRNVNKHDCSAEEKGEAS